jgi:hypothetical protein
MISTIRASANILLKVVPEDGAEKIIGFVTSVALSMGGTQRVIHGVDSVYPQEIAYGAGPSQVGLSMSLVMPKGQTLESLGLVPYRTGGGNSPLDTGNSAAGANTVYGAGGRYIHLRLYDRITGELFYGVDFCKVNSFSITAQSKSIIRADLQYTGMFLIPGVG